MTPIIKGVPTDPPAQDEADKRRADSLLRLETFAKWLFATIATVGTLGTALGANGYGDLEGSGQTLFSLAILAAALSLAAATFALVPILRKVQPMVEGSRDKAARGVLYWRTAWLWTAGLFFAAALALAGIAPMVSSREKDDIAPEDVTWTLKEGRKFNLTAKIDGGTPFGEANLIARREPLAKRAVVTRARVTLNDDGDGELSVRMHRLKGAKRIVARLAYDIGDAKVGRRTVRRHEIPLRSATRTSSN